MNQVKIPIAIADDHILVREGICSLISSFQEFNIVIQANNGDEMIRKLCQTNTMPDICILDINMPIKNGWETLANIRHRWPNMKVIILTSLNEINVTLKAIQCGANGYLCKCCNHEELKRALYDTHNYGYYFPNTLAGTLYARVGKPCKTNLSLREHEFLKFCCEEYTYKEIAQRMKISTRTVEKYRDTLFDKLDIKTRVGLILYAIKNGVVSVLDSK